MPRLWLLQQSIAGLEVQMRLSDRSPAGGLVENLADVLAPAAVGGVPVRPRLAIDDDLFDLDLFEEGVTFVSERLARAMALPAEAADLGDVDDGGCSATVRRMGYRTLSLKCRADALDRDASDGDYVEWVDPDGVLRSDWLLAVPGPNTPPPRARWRGGFEPPAELFLVDGTPWRAATDELAERVTAIGSLGVDFVDPVASAATGDLVTRGRRCR